MINIKELTDGELQMAAEEMAARNEINIIDKINALANGAGLVVTIKKADGRSRKAPIKYLDGYGNEWSGRGRQPKWLTEAMADGEPLESFLVVDN